MSTKIITAENALNAVLPASRLVHSPAAALSAAAVAWSGAVWAEALKLGPMALGAEQLKQGHQLALHPVYICGVHRSGTTLVRDLLDDHPELVVLPSEGTFYTNLEQKLKHLADDDALAYLATEWLRRLANPINQPPHWLLGRTEETKSPYVDFARYMIAWWKAIDRSNTIWPHLAVVLAYASASGKLQAKYWVDKTPTNERFLSRIWANSPQAKIIHVIREPLATLLSRQKMEPSVSLRRILTDMKRSFHIAIKKPLINKQAFLLLRYEELCENPHKLMQGVANFLNIRHSPLLERPTVAGKPSQANSSFIRDAQPGYILKNDSQQAADSLSTAHYQLLASYLGKTAAKLNYSLVNASPFYGLYLRLKHKLL